MFCAFRNDTLVFLYIGTMCFDIWCLSNQYLFFNRCILCILPINKSSIIWKFRSRRKTIPLERCFRPFFKATFSQKIFGQTFLGTGNLWGRTTINFHIWSFIYFFGLQKCDAGLSGNGTIFWNLFMQLCCSTEEKHFFGQTFISTWTCTYCNCLIFDIFFQLFRVFKKSR